MHTTAQSTECKQHLLVDLRLAERPQPFAEGLQSGSKLQQGNTKSTCLLIEFGLRQRGQPVAKGLQEGLDGGVQMRCRVGCRLDDENLCAQQRHRSGDGMGQQIALAKLPPS